MFEPKITPGLVKALTKVSAAAAAVTKAHQPTSGPKFKYTSAVDTLMEIQRAVEASGLAVVGVQTLAASTEHTSNGYLSSVTKRVWVSDGEGVAFFDCYGTGLDPRDFSAGKAHTYALKYGWRDFLTQPWGPDNEAGEDGGQRATHTQSRPKRPKVVEHEGTPALREIALGVKDGKIDKKAGQHALNAWMGTYPELFDDAGEVIDDAPKQIALAIQQTIKIIEGAK